MHSTLALFFSLVMSFALFCGGSCGPPCHDDPIPPGSKGCAATFFPTYNVRTRWDFIRKGVIIEWSWRKATPGTYKVFRCSYNCIYREEDGRYLANLRNFQPITDWIATSHLDMNVTQQTTYYYAVQNQYQPCGVYWSENYAGITTP
jgi:hypothetical protein